MQEPLLQFLCDAMAQALFDPDDTKLKRYGKFYPKKVIHKVIKLKQNRPHVGLSSPSKVLKTTSKTTVLCSKTHSKSVMFVCYMSFDMRINNKKLLN